MTSRSMVSRGPIRVSLFGLRGELIFILVIMILVIVTRTAYAQASEAAAATTVSAPNGASSVVTMRLESSLTATFGMRAGSGLAGCKTEELSKATVRELKADCKAWMRDQKNHLKSRFIAYACDEACADCGMSLHRCMVNGTIRYNP